MKLSALALSAVLAVSAAGSAFAGSCCASKKAESVAAAAACADKKGADCSKGAETAGTCNKDKASTSSATAIAPLASAAKN